MIRLACETDKDLILRYDRHISEERLEVCIRDEQVYVLLEGDKLVGVLRYSLFWQRLPFMDLLYLDEVRRGMGYGRRLVGHWEAQLRSRGYGYAMTSTQTDETAKYFYEKLGYHRAGAFLPPEQEVEELVYWKAL